MGKKTKEQVISQEEYFARLEQGVPVGDCRIDMGNGELAYALYEVVVVGVPFNKYADKFFEMLEVNVCVANMNLPGPKNGANQIIYSRMFLTL
jgi:hypothetical protein